MGRSQKSLSRLLYDGNCVDVGLSAFDRLDSFHPSTPSVPKEAEPPRPILISVYLIQLYRQAIIHLCALLSPPTPPPHSWRLVIGLRDDIGIAGIKQKLDKLNIRIQLHTPFRNTFRVNRKGLLNRQSVNGTSRSIDNIPILKLQA
jgi:hypothetical protein